MAFFLPSSTPTSTTTSLSSSPLPVLRPLDSEDESRQSPDGNRSLRHHPSDDLPSTRSGFSMFGLLSRRIEYISGASDSDISSLESSESEVESRTRRATFGDDEDEFDDDGTNTRTTRDARSPSGRRRSPDNIHDPAAELSVGRSRSQGATNQNAGEEIVKRRRNHSSTQGGRRSARWVKLRNRRDSHVYEAYICKYVLKICYRLGRFILSISFRESVSLKPLRLFHAARDFFLVITLCFGFACAWMVLARPILMNWFGFAGRRSADEYMYMDG